MPPSVDPELYRLGLGLSRRIFNRLDDLITNEYPTKTPILLSQIIRRLVTSVVSYLQTSRDERTSKYALRSLKIVGTHLKYLESASSSRVPTSIITPLERVVRHAHPDAHVMIRVQSSYNYTVSNIIDTYRNLFKALLPDFDLLLNGVTHLYVVGVPGVEDGNILLHALLAHELGHRIADKYLESEDQQQLIQNIESQIGTDLTWHTAEFLNLPPHFHLPLRQRVFALVLEARKRALEELISDAVGYYLVGVTMLFAAQELTASGVIDSLPTEGSRWYPPWRYRIRSLLDLAIGDDLERVLKSIEGPDPICKIKDSALQFFTALKTISAQSSDITLIQTDGIVSRAYKDIPTVMKAIPAFIASELTALGYRPDVLAREIATLLERISFGIPPDDCTAGPPDFRSALTAGWLYRTARIPVPYLAQRTWNPDDDETLNRLVLKGIESIELIREYRKSSARN